MYRTSVLYSCVACLSVCALLSCDVIGEESISKVGPTPVPHAIQDTVFVLTTEAISRAALYDSGDPTAAEQYVLELINRARANPTAEGARLGISITEGLSASNVALVGVRPPLAINKILLSIARAHSQDMWTRSFFAHNNPDGKSPFVRMTDAGYNYTRAGENIACGSSSTPAALEDLLMIDAGVSGRGHRLNLLDIYNPPYFREVGIGCYSGSGVNGMGYKDFLTQDFGTTATGPFLVGVVYNDANSNNFYDIGEGVGNVTVTPTGGAYYAVTSSSGGYAIPISGSGSLTVTFSGGSLTSPVTKTVNLAGANVKLDLVTSGGGGGGDGDGDDDGNSVSGIDTDSDGYPDELETEIGWNPNSPSTFPKNVTVFDSSAKTSIKLNFKQNDRDTINLSWLMSIAAGFSVTDRQIAVDIGGVIVIFQLNCKGQATNEHGSFKLGTCIKNGIVTSCKKPARIRVKLTRGAFSTNLFDEGLNNACVSKANRTIPITVVFFGESQHNIIKGNFQVIYTAKLGKTGNAKGGL
ncbi:MAG: CAP domain-containing protein [Planctomycetota bacterium]